MRVVSKLRPARMAPRKRVAAYARVPVETDALLHSLSAQVSYYSMLIQANPEWEYAGVYADEGVTRKRRSAFCRFSLIPFCVELSGALGVFRLVEYCRFPS